MNHLSHFLLVKLLENRLLTSASSSCSSRVIVVSSESHRQSFLSRSNISQEYLSPPTSSRFVAMIAYNDSKLCNVLFASQLNQRLSRHNVFASSLHPGNLINTGLSRNWWFYRLLWTVVRPFTKSCVSLFENPSQVVSNLSMMSQTYYRNKELRQLFMRQLHLILKMLEVSTSITVLEVRLPIVLKMTLSLRNFGG